MDRCETRSGGRTTKFTPGLDMGHEKKFQSRMIPRHFVFLGFVVFILSLSNRVT